MTKLSADQLKEIKAELLEKSFKFRQSNGIDNYLNAAILEGIEMKGNNINPFVVGDDGDRVYGYENVGIETRAAVSIIEQILMEPVPEPAAEEQEPAKQEVETKESDIVPKEDKQLYGILPKYLTDAILAKHPGTTAALIGLQKTPPDYVKIIADKSGKPILKNGSETHYVEGHVMKMEANFAFLFNWDTEVLEASEYDYEFTALVQCTFRFTEGSIVVKTQEGGADKKFSKKLKDKEGNPRLIMIADTKKAAITDGVKRCIADLGVNQDVYSGAV
jgi:hypothetical protein